MTCLLIINKAIVAALSFLMITSTNVQGEFSTREIRGPCLESSFTLITTDGCDINAIRRAIQVELDIVGCRHSAITELRYLTGLKRQSHAIEAINEVCMKAWNAIKEETFVPFTDVVEQDNPDVFTKAYFDGDTYWNDARQSLNEDGQVVDVLSEDPGKTIEKYRDHIATNGLTWPDGTALANFQGCRTTAAMCCYVQDRQANDDNGNCDEEYDTNCIDSDPGDNTDVCFVDMKRSHTSARVRRGYSIFEGAGEGAAHCHGFAWAKDPNDFLSVYKANTLFYVSMYDHLYKRGYVNNVPGAPMCACAEKMPSVTRADCTEPTITQTTEWFFFGNGNVEAKIWNDAHITYNACDGGKGRKDNDLAAYYERLESEGKVTDFHVRNLRDSTLVGNGNCDLAINSFMEGHGWSKE